MLYPWGYNFYRIAYVAKKALLIDAGAKSIFFFCNLTPSNYLSERLTNVVYDNSIIQATSSFM